jgi:glycosyltransferase involved in cell wall biosynthesis
MSPIAPDLIQSVIARVPHTAACVLQIGGDEAIGAAYGRVNADAIWLLAPGGSSAVAIQELLRERRPDAVVCGEPRELTDTVPALVERLAPNAVVVTVSPNQGRASVVTRLLRGEAVEDIGETRTTAIAKVRAAGLYAIDWAPAGHDPEADGARHLLEATSVSADTPAEARQRLSTLAWVVRASPRPPSNPLTIVALGLRKMAGVTDARIDHPLTAMASLPHVTAVWGSGTVGIPRGKAPGVFILHRQFLHTPAAVEMVEGMIGRGWTVVSEIDDDPHHWDGYVDSDFRAFRGVHAVSVSTEPLARMIRQWNPEVAVFPNQIAVLPEAPATTPKSDGRIRVFFGALNREGDWSAIMDQIQGVVARHPDRLELVVVHDRAFFDQLPSTLRKTFHPTLPHAEYMAVLASCDLALLPLADTPFNRLKSDLKLIECAAAGVVPLCSPVIYDEDPHHRTFAWIVDDVAQWGEGLLQLLSSPKEIERRRRAGLAHVRAQRMHSHHVNAREAWFRDIIARRDALEAGRLERLSTLSMAGT